MLAVNITSQIQRRASQRVVMKSLTMKDQKQSLPYDRDDPSAVVMEGSFALLANAFGPTVGLKKPKDDGLTARKKQFVSSQPVHDRHSQATMSLAQCKLRGLLAWQKIRENLLIYGTSSKILDQKRKYRSNLSEIMLEKRHRERPKKVKAVPSVGLLFHPDNLFKQIWNLVILALLFYVFIATPWIIAFEEIQRGDSLFYLELCVDLLFLCDVLITLNSAYFQGKVLVTSRCRIFKNYATGLMLIDIVAIFPFWVFEGEGGGNSSKSLIRIIRITKVTRVFRASKLLRVLRHVAQMAWLERFRKLMKMHSSITRLLTMGYTIMILSHFVACMWFFTAKLDGFAPVTWVQRHGFGDSSNSRLYLASLYWTFTTLTTVGFGDIYAFTPSEMVLTILWMLVGIGFYTLLIGSLASVLGSMDAKKLQLKQHSETIEVFSARTRLDKELKKQLKEQVALAPELEVFDEFKRMEVLHLLSKDLRVQVCMHMNGNAATQIEFFKDKDGVFVANIIPRMNFVREPAFKTLYKVHDYPDRIYFVVLGRVNYLSGRKSVIFKHMVQGGYFGEIELIEGIPRLFSVQTSIECEFLVLPKVLFLDVAESYPKVYQEFCENSKEKKRRDLTAMHEILELLVQKDIEKKEYEHLAGKTVQRTTHAHSSLTRTSEPSPLSPQAGIGQDKIADIKRQLEELNAQIESVQRCLPSPASHVVMVTPPVN